MHIERVRLINYSSFVDTGWIELSPHLNVVVGQNNSGKTSFLDALNGNVPNNPHRDESAYLPGMLKTPRSEIDLWTTTSEVRSRLAATSATVRLVIDGMSDADRQVVLSALQSDHDLILRLKSEAGQGLSARQPVLKDYLRPDAGYSVEVSMSNGELHLGGISVGPLDTLQHVFSSGEHPNFFKFSAQRQNIAWAAFGTERRLHADARNLPSVLAYLSGNQPDLFEEIQDRVREVLPSVSAITISTEDGNFKIILWPSADRRIRELAFDLTSSGTGVAQVIAILTAVITSPPSVMCIDEINSYLHPTAIKQLLQICTTYYRHHQYIVSTHSAEVMSFHSIDRMFLVEKSGFISSIRTIERSDISSVRIAFRHLGIGMSDVLGSDRIVWVEGETEEIAFPNLAVRAGLSLPATLSFTAVAATGDFTRRGSSPKPVIDLYEAATAAVAPLVEGTSFLLDREKLSDDAVEQIERKTSGKLILLPRRCIECYAMHPEAISKVLNEDLGDKSFLPSDVNDCILSLATDRKYGGASKWNMDLANEDWLRKVDGAKLLSDVFAILSAGTLSFQKTLHTPRILSLVAVDDLTHLVQAIRAAIAAAGAQATAVNKP